MDINIKLQDRNMGGVISLLSHAVKALFAINFFFNIFLIINVAFLFVELSLLVFFQITLPIYKIALFTTFLSAALLLSWLVIKKTAVIIFNNSVACTASKFYILLALCIAYGSIWYMAINNSFIYLLGIVFAGILWFISIKLMEYFEKYDVSRINFHVSLKIIIYILLNYLAYKVIPFTSFFLTNYTI